MLRPVIGAVPRVGLRVTPRLNLLCRSSTLRHFSTPARNSGLHIGLLGYKPGVAQKSVTGHASVFGYDANKNKVLFAKGWYPTREDTDFGVVQDDSALLDKPYAHAQIWAVSDEQMKKAMLEIAQWERRSELEQAQIRQNGHAFDISGMSEEMDKRYKRKPTRVQVHSGGDSPNPDDVAREDDAPEGITPYDPERDYELWSRNCIHMARDVVKATQRDVDTTGGVHSVIDLADIDSLIVKRPSPLIGKGKLLSQTGPLIDKLPQMAQQSQQKAPKPPSTPPTPPSQSSSSTPQVPPQSQGSPSSSAPQVTPKSIDKSKPPAPEEPEPSGTRHSAFGPDF